KSEKVSKQKQLKKEAEKQLKAYSIDQRFKKNMKKTTLIKLVLIFCGHELIEIDAVDRSQ
ncbi:MAG: hypothetical protein GY757_23805, partial [bacterium]|nr:hypothetical protein [bacterium]